MILVDTSIWIEHFRAAEPQLVALLMRNEVLAHPFVIGEIALGGVARRSATCAELRSLSERWRRERRSSEPGK